MLGASELPVVKILQKNKKNVKIKMQYLKNILLKLKIL
jgi:hypothetical protein